MMEVPKEADKAALENQSETDTPVNRKDSSEIQKDSAETLKDSSESFEASLEKKNDSEETQNNSSEKQNDSAEKQKDSLEKQKGSSKKLEDSSLKQNDFSEKKNDSSETQYKSSEKQNDSAEKQKASVETLKDSADTCKDSSETLKDSPEMYKASSENQKDSSEKNDTTCNDKEVPNQKKDHKNKRKNVLKLKVNAPEHSEESTAKQSPKTDNLKKKDSQEQKEDSPENGAFKLYVTGFPRYITAQNLLQAMTPFCHVKIEKLTGKFAVITCDDAQESERALAATKKANIYGFLLNIRRYNPKTDEPRPPKKETPRNFVRSKQKNGEIVHPNALDLSGDFYTQLDTILASVRLTQDEVQRISDLYADVEAALATIWPGCIATPFGSITTGLGIKTSDADCFIDIPVCFKTPEETFVNKAKRVLQQLPQIFAEILSIPRANTPIVKFYHIPTNTNCDLSFKTPLGAQNSKLITFLLHCNPKLIPIAVIIKYWAKVHDLSGTGKLSNYALTMLLIFYLQQPPLFILPTVEWLQREPTFDLIVDYWNTGFMHNKNFLPICTNKSTIAELLGGFFQFYSTFNFEELVVCPYLGVAIPKVNFIKLELPVQFARYVRNTKSEVTYPLRATTPLCIQDPFEQSRNVSSAIGGRMAEEMVAFFDFAAKAYEKEKTNNCNNFLKIILTDRPKIPKKMGHPEFRHAVFSRFLNSVDDAVWKSTIRQIVFDIFEKILKLKLCKFEEKPNPESKTEKERYWTLMHKAVWRRKEVSKNLKYKILEFFERERLITEEILSKDNSKISFEFQIILKYNLKPRSAVITIKLSGGDDNQFVEFGRFFLSTMHGWVANLSRIYKKELSKAELQFNVRHATAAVHHVGIPSDDDTDSNDDSVNITESVYIRNHSNKDIGTIIERVAETSKSE